MNAETIFVNPYDRDPRGYMEAVREFYSRQTDGVRKRYYRMIGEPLSGKTILDVGCGYGQDLDYFQSRGARIYGIDIAPRVLELAQETYPSLVNLSVQSFERTDFPDGFFDITVSRYGIELVEDLKDFYTEINRILKIGGILCLICPHPLADFLRRKDADYGKRETVRKRLYGGRWVINEPSHFLSDYLNGNVFRFFDLVDFLEGNCPANRLDDGGGKIKVPDYLILKYRKRTGPVEKEKIQ